MLTAGKKTKELAYLNDVSAVPLRQTLHHRRTAFAHFFAERSDYPRSKTRKKSRRSAEYTRSAFRFTGEKVADPRDERRDRAGLAKAQRAYSRREKGSAVGEEAGTPTA